MPELSVRPIETDLRALFRRHAPENAALEIVDSVPDWLQERGVQDGNPFRQAVSFPERNLVVMSSVMTTDLARSSASLLTLGPFVHEALAQDLEKYARYLLLHEIAHLRGMLDEPTADEWALARLNEHLLEAGKAPIEA